MSDRPLRRSTQTAYALSLPSTATDALYCWPVVTSLIRVFGAHTPDPGSQRDETTSICENGLAAGLAR